METPPDLRFMVLRTALCLIAGSIPLQAFSLELAKQGETIFLKRCVVCHGTQADGKSDLAKIMRPPPANLRASKLQQSDKQRIIQEGGAFVGRSPNMPAWKAELTEPEIQSVLAYLDTIKETTPRP